MKKSKKKDRIRQLSPFTKNLFIRNENFIRKNMLIVQKLLEEIKDAERQNREWLGRNVNEN